MSYEDIGTPLFTPDPEKEARAVLHPALNYIIFIGFIGSAPNLVETNYKNSGKSAPVLYVLFVLRTPSMNCFIAVSY